MDENLYEYIDRRERELTHQIAALEGQLAQRKHELNHIRTVRGSLPQPPSGGMLETVVGLPPIPDHRTIKELVIQALLDHFPNGGSLVDIRDFIQDAYGRDILPSSLRPQMHRLKADGVLGQEPSTDTWNFRDGKRSLYARYDHPTSRKAMKELQDEPSDEEVGQFIAENRLLGKITEERAREILRKRRVKT